MTLMLPQDGFTTVRSLAPLLDILKMQPHLLSQVQQRFHIDLGNASMSTPVSVATFRSILQFLYHAGIDDIAYRMAFAVDVGTFGVLDYYLHSCETVQEAISELSRFSPLIARNTSPLQIEVDQQRVVLWSLMPAAYDEGERLRLQALAALMVRYLQLLIHDPDYFPLRLETPLAPDENLSRRSRYFGEQVSYHCKRFALHYPVDLLNKRLRNANQAVKAALKPEVENQLQRALTQASTKQQILEWFESSDDLLKATQATAADYLHMSESSLKRRLSEEDITFTDLLTGYRRKVALSLLAEEKNKMEYIARRLGFSERSAFERAFRSWFSITPAQFRLETQLCHLHEEHYVKLSDCLPPVPKVCQDVLLLTQNATYDTRRLVELLAQDPVLTARIMGLANSPYYGAGRVANLWDAVQRVLGAAVVRNLAILMAGTQTLTIPEQKHFNRELHWLSVLSVNYLVTQLVARVVDTRLNKEVLSLVSLLHGIGLLLLVHTQPDEVKLLNGMGQNIDDESMWPVIDQRVFGVDRFAAGSILLSHWHMPQDVCRRVRSLAKNIDVGVDAESAFVQHILWFVGNDLSNRDRDDDDFNALDADQRKKVRGEELAGQLLQKFGISEAYTENLVSKWREQLPDMRSSVRGLFN